MSYVAAVDIGGTFTDLVAYDRSTGRLISTKSPTTYQDFAKGILDCFSKAELSLESTALVNHGTTLVINALLQRQGAKTALATTKGFRDILEIARGNRPDPFDLQYSRDEPLIPRELRYEIEERTDARGEVLLVLKDEEIVRLAEVLRSEGVEAVAVFLINSYANPEPERRLAERLRALLSDVYVSCSVDLTREWYEYERCATVCANAFVGPGATGYLRRLDRDFSQRGFRGSLHVMASNGGLSSLEEATRRPIALVESGPVGGCIGAAAYARALGLPSVIAFDMGGTTAKCAHISEGRFTVENLYHVGGYVRGFPVRSPVINIAEVGSGGGSIARVDPQGRLSVGPESAGSTPGPACYGRGGDAPTITDANLVLGRLNADKFVGGELRLDLHAASSAIKSVADPLGYVGMDGLARLAEGILTISIAVMADAVRQVSIVQGLDPRDFVLFSYGGGGPLHASALARELSIPKVVIPPAPGNFSALGMLLSDARLDSSSTFVRPVAAGILEEMEAAFGAMEEPIEKILRRDFGTRPIVLQKFVEMRFLGQRHNLKIDVSGITSVGALKDKFVADYGRRYGHAAPAAAVHAQALHLSAYVESEKPDIAHLIPRPDIDATPGRREVYFGEDHGWLQTAIYDRRSLPVGFDGKGPAAIEEYGSTTLVGPKDRFSVGQIGEILIHCSQT